MTFSKPHYDVVLVQPNITWVYDPFEHLGLAYLAAALRRDGFSVKIIDAVLLRLKMADLYRELDRYDIGVLGVTIISHGYLVTTKLLEFYRERHPETHIVAGGHFATFAAAKMLAHSPVFDAIVLGEGEYTFSEYCRAVLGGESSSLDDIAIRDRPVVRSQNRIRDMDALAFPARDNLPLAMSRGANPGLTSSRGCYARCAFCTVHNFYTARNGPRWIARSIDNVIAELEALRAEFKIDHFMFVDDNFIGPGQKGQERALEFADAYRRSKLPMTFHIDCRAVDIQPHVVEELCAAGLRSIFIGIESVAPSDLRLFRKDLRADANWRAAEAIKRLGLDYTLSMIMFNPLTDEGTILANIEFLKQAEYYPRNPMAVLNLYEGTDLNETFKDYLHGPFWDYRFNFAHETTRTIYEEGLRFCKETLPLERRLSARPDGGLESRRQLHQARLLFLEDLTRNIHDEAVDEIRARWAARLAELEDEMGASSASTDPVHLFEPERRYMTGSPLDPDIAAVRPAACLDALVDHEVPDQTLIP